MADDDASDVKIRIATEYQGAGADAAVDGMGQVKEATVEATAATQDLGSATESADEQVSNFGHVSLREAAHSVHGLETAMTGGHMSTYRWMMSLRALYATIEANPFIALAAAVGAVALAIGEWIKKSAEAREQIEKDLEQTAEKNAEAMAEIGKAATAAKFDGLKQGLDAVNEKYAALNKAAKEQLNLSLAMGDAQTGKRLAEIDLAEARELAGARGDAVKEAEIKANYSGQKLDLKNANEESKAQKRLEDAEKEAARLAAQRKDLEAKRQELDTPLPEQGAYEAMKAQLARDLRVGATYGIRSEQQVKLDREDELAKKSPEKLSSSEAEDLRDLRAHHKETEAALAEAPTFSKKEQQSYATNSSMEELASLRATMEAAIAKSNLPKDSRESIDAQNRLNMFTLAERILAAKEQLPDLKGRASTADEKQKGLLSKSDAAIGALPEEEKKAREAVQLALAKKAETEAQIATSNFTTQQAAKRTLDAATLAAARKKQEDDAKDRAVRERALEEQIKGAREIAGAQNSAAKTEQREETAEERQRRTHAGHPEHSRGGQNEHESQRQPGRAAPPASAVPAPVNPEAQVEALENKLLELKKQDILAKYADRPDLAAIETQTLVKAEMDRRNAANIKSGPATGNPAEIIGVAHAIEGLRVGLPNLQTAANKAAEALKANTGDPAAIAGLVTAFDNLIQSVSSTEPKSVQDQIKTLAKRVDTLAKQIKTGRQDHG